MPGLRTHENELGQYVSSAHDMLDIIPGHSQTMFKSTNNHFVNKSSSIMENFEYMHEPESAYFSDNPELLSPEKSAHERDLEIEVLDIDELGILTDTEEVDNKNCSNSVDEHLNNEFEIASSSPLKSDESTSLTTKVRHKNCGRSQIRNYKCNHCGFSTQDSRKYLHHLKDVHNEEFIIHECNNCNYATKIIKNLQRHCYKVHSEEMQIYSESSRQLSEKFLSCSQKKLKKNSAKFHCSSCSFNTTSERILKVHVTSHNQIVEEKSTEITDTNTTKYSEYNKIKDNESIFHSNNEIIALAEHLTSQKQKSHKCPLCKMDIKYISWMIRHLRINHRGNVQAETLAAAYEMKKRKKRPNHSDWPISENNLGKRTNRHVSSSTLKRRQMNLENFISLSDTPMQHMDSDNALRCNICYDEFNEMAEFQEHIQIHSTTSLEISSAVGVNSIKNDKFENIEVNHNASKISKVQKQSTILKYVRNELGSKLSNQKYKCPYCTFSIKSVSRFHLHFIKHLKNLEFMCSDCDYRSNWKWTVVKHIWSKNCNEQNHINATVFTNNDLVDLNSFKLYKKYLVNLNQSNSVNDQLNVFQLNSEQENQSSWSAKSDMFSVDNCLNSVKTTTVSNLRSPIVADPSKETNYYYCKECSYKNVNKQIIINHLASHSDIKPFQCRVCNFKTNWKHVLVRHVKNIHAGDIDDIIENKINYIEEGSVLCCDYGFKNNDKSYEYPKLTSHKVYSCHICPYKSHKEYYLNFHVKQHRYREGANYKCEDCPYFVKYLKSLIKHKKLHNSHSLNAGTRESLHINTEHAQEFQSTVHTVTSSKKIFRKKSLSCPKCPARFGQLDRYHRHVALHGKDYKFKCDHCDFSVQLAANLLQHKRVHEMKTILKVSSCSKSFACPRCPAVFTIKHRYERHLKFHNRNYSNQGGFFPVQRNVKLIKSKNLHMNKNKLVRLSRSFKCPKCPARLQSLERHARHLEHHGGNYRFTCSYCDFSVQNAVNIQKHEKIHHVKSDSELPEYSVIPESLNDTDKVEEIIPVEAAINVVTSERKLYICDRCPYYSASKTAVQSHQRSHWLKQNFECPHCDYSATQRSSLQTHLKLHLEGSNLFPPEAFMKFQSFKIIIQEENGEKLVFDDETMVNGDRECQYDTTSTESDNIQNSQSESKEANENYSTDIVAESEPFYSHLKAIKEPIVVLTDIFKKNFLKQQKAD